MTNRTKKLSGLKTIGFLAIPYTVLITLVFLSPKINLNYLPTRLQVDKIGHVAIYLLLVLGWLLFFYQKFSFQLHFKKALFIAVACFGYGIIIEVIQETMIPVRQADIIDVLANTIGILIGSLLFWKLKIKKML